MALPGQSRLTLFPQAKQGPRPTGASPALVGAARGRGQGPGTHTECARDPHRRATSLGLRTEVDSEGQLRTKVDREEWKGTEKEGGETWSRAARGRKGKGRGGTEESSAALR